MIIDLSHGNVLRQDRILASDARSEDPVAAASLDRYWDEVWSYRENDIRHTGNDHRFDADHPFVSREFSLIAAHLADITPPPPPIATLAVPPPATVVVESSPPPYTGPGGITTSAVPEPSGLLSLGVAIVLVGFVTIFRERK
jgi:hypothetical protein